jgi:hypothetical protein
VETPLQAEGAGLRQLRSPRSKGNIHRFRVPPKHLPGAGGGHNKFLGSVDHLGSTYRALASPKRYVPVRRASRGFQVITNLGQTVGTKRQQSVKVVVGWDGRIWTSYPLK